MKEIEKVAKKILSSVKSKSKVVTSYDQVEDVLYINFRSSPIQKEDFGIKFDDYILSFKDNKTVVGITVLNAKKHLQKKFKDMPPISKKGSAIVLV